MGTPRRRKSLSVKQQLVEQPGRFEFSQAVRLLEMLAINEHSWDMDVADEAVGYDRPSSTEAIRFNVHQSLEFPASEIVKVETSTNSFNNQNRKQYNLTVALMGLTGASGVLPYHYTELILQRIRLKDDAFRTFLDHFNHRTLSLFYRASQKYRFPITYERNFNVAHKSSVTQWGVRAGKRFPDADLFTDTLRSISGIGTSKTQERIKYLDDNLLKYAAYWGQGTRNASNLKRMLADYFSFPVVIEQFSGQWQEIVPDMLTRLPFPREPLGQNACLGMNAMLGHRCWTAQSKFRIRLTPLTYKQYLSIRPGSDKLNALKEMVRLYVGVELDYDIQLQIPANELPPAKLTKSSKSGIQLGWNGYLPNKKDDDKIVDIRIG
ncbi:hypothetical protein A9Q99_06680 [Gammaproteobacteria bacterium 45_16_T64]|nr:hypothetical protein A9Q99_06680 [Gammaproteobacteria bacterium 45_16_T64]